MREFFRYPPRSKHSRPNRRRVSTNRRGFCDLQLQEEARCSPERHREIAPIDGRCGCLLLHGMTKVEEDRSCKENHHPVLGVNDCHQLGGGGVRNLMLKRGVPRTPRGQAGLGHVRLLEALFTDRLVTSRDAPVNSSLALRLWKS
ncbi:unnamed protein product [Lampetra fluviatilis]